MDPAPMTGVLIRRQADRAEGRSHVEAGQTPGLRAHEPKSARYQHLEMRKGSWERGQAHTAVSDYWPPELGEPIPAV